MKPSLPLSRQPFSGVAAIYGVTAISTAVSTTVCIFIDNPFLEHIVTLSLHTSLRT